MTECIESQIPFSFYSSRRLTADFEGGQITSDAGLLALRQFDHHRRLTASLVRALTDPRCSNKVGHPLASLLRQRLYQIVAGYEDANDADRLRHDPTFQLLADRSVGEPLASQPTLSRWENSFSARDWVRLNRLLLDWFFQLCSAPVRERGEIVLDLDSTADPTHGQQEFSFYNGAYGEPIYHPLLVFERHTGCLLAAHLRPGQVGSPTGCIAVLRRLLLRLVRRFPGLRIRVCADAAFPLPKLYRFLERHGIGYAIGMPRNTAIARRAQRTVEKAERRWLCSGQPPCRFSSFRYRGKRWHRQRRICYKVEHRADTSSIRFLATNLPGRAEEVFHFYQGRGECENRIEELKNGFAADRLSCHRFLANAFRLLLHGFAYNLVNLFRLRLPPALRSAQIETLRNRIFKLGARIRQTARRVWVHLASGWPWQSLFQQICRSLDSG